MVFDDPINNILINAITAYPWDGVSVGQHYKDWPQVGLAPGGSSTYTPTPTYTTLFLDQTIELYEPCSRRYETEIMSKRR